MSKRRSNGGNQTTPVAQDVEYEEVEALESEVENETGTKAPESEEKKKSLFKAAKGGVKKVGTLLVGVAVGIGGSLVAGYLMSRKDQPAALEEGDVEYYDFEDNEQPLEEEEYPGD